MVAHHELRERLEHRHLDRLAAAGALRIEDGGQQRDRRLQPHRAVGQRDRRVARLGATLLREQRGDADGPLNQVVVRGLAGVRAVFAVTEGADVDDLRIHRRHRVVTQAEPRHRLRADVVDQRIATRRQTQAGIAALGLLEVEDDRALVAVQVHRHRAHAGVAHRADGAQVVAGRRLDLDDVGTQVAERLRGVRPHHHGGQVENAQAVQRALRGCQRHSG